MKTGNPEIDDSTADWVIGSDEVGYGAWAGPLVVGGTLLPRSWFEPGVGDSKKLTPNQRRKLFVRFTLSTPVTFHLVQVSSQEIDQMGVGQALYRAHRDVLRTLLPKAPSKPLIVVDGFLHGTDALEVPGSIGLPKADALVPAVSLASIIAKQYRDDLMVKFAAEYGGYDFASNKGYRSEAHERGLAKYGPCAIHRKSYSPIARLLGGDPVRKPEGDLTEPDDFD